jgi:hypothetical protein
MALAEEGETAELVRTSGIGVSVPPDAGVEAIEHALLTLMTMSLRQYAPPPLALYDGRVHAATTANLLTQLAQSGRGGKPVETSAIVATRGATLRTEKSQR